MDENDYLEPKQVAEKLGMSTATLAQLRYKGTGPAFMQLSPRKIRYSASEVDRWAKSRTRTTTAAVA